MTTSIECDLNNESGLVSISWVNIEDTFFIKHFLSNEFHETTLDKSNNINIPVGEFLNSVQNIIDFWNLNKHLIDELNVSSNLKSLYQD